MRKFKLLAIFLIFAVIGLADMSKSSVSSSDIIKDSNSQHAMYVSDGRSFTKYISTSGKSEDILNDIKSVISSVRGQTIYVKDYSMYQRLRSLGASYITNLSDEIVSTSKYRSGRAIYMVRF